MININDPTRNIKQQLQENVKLEQFTVEVGECVNENPSLTPWLGVYKTQVRHDPNTLGTTRRHWKGTITLTLLVQATSLKSGEDCGELLEDYIQNVLDAVLNDTTFGNSVDMVNKFDVTYSYERTESDSLFFQDAYITLECEVENEY
jgi:hypothetical protein